MLVPQTAQLSDGSRTTVYKDPNGNLFKNVNGDYVNCNIEFGLIIPDSNTVESKQKSVKKVVEKKEKENTKADRKIGSKQKSVKKVVEKGEYMGNCVNNHFRLYEICYDMKLEGKRDEEIVKNRIQGISKSSFAINFIGFIAALVFSDGKSESSMAIVSSTIFLLFSITAMDVCGKSRKEGCFCTRMLITLLILPILVVRFVLRILLYIITKNCCQDDGEYKIEGWERSLHEVRIMTVIFVMNFVFCLVVTISDKKEIGGLASFIVLYVGLLNGFINLAVLMRARVLRHRMAERN
jgi:hypothetical protein